MRIRHFLLVAIFGLALPSPAAHAQIDPSQHREFHARVAAVIAELGRGLPPGDTLLTWSPNPSLFHTVGGNADSLRSGLLRGDEMLGVAESRWAHGVLTQFETRWTKGDSILVHLRGRRDGSTLRITGSRDTTLVLPELPWAVADYGMDEHLAPLLHTFAPSSAPRSIAVLRPYLIKWDTVAVIIDRRAGVLVTSTAGGKARETLVFAADMRLIWAKRSDVVSELRPLEGSARHAEFLRLRAALGTLP